MRVLRRQHLLLSLCFLCTISSVCAFFDLCEPSGWLKQRTATMLKMPTMMNSYRDVGLLKQHIVDAGMKGAYLLFYFLHHVFLSAIVTKISSGRGYVRRMLDKHPGFVNQTNPLGSSGCAQASVSLFWITRLAGYTALHQAAYYGASYAVLEMLHR